MAAGVWGAEPVVPSGLHQSPPRRRRRRPARSDVRDAGLAPVETAVVAAALALIFVGLFVFLNRGSGPKVDANAPGDTEVQVALLLPTDIHSVDPSSAKVDVRPTTTASDCSGRLPGLRVLHLAWINADDGRFTIDYVVAHTAQDDRLVRHTCVNDTASSLVLGQDIDTASAAVPGGANAKQTGATVAMRVAVRSASGKRSNFTVEGTQREVESATTLTPTTLTPTALTSTTGATPISGATPAKRAATPSTKARGSTVVPSEQCTIATGAVTASPASVARSAAGALAADVTIHVRTKGPCHLLTANFAGKGAISPGSSAVVLAPVVPSSAPDVEDWAGMIDPQSTGWATGSYLVTILDSGRPIVDAPVATFAVTSPCTVDSFTISASIVLLDAGKLADAIDVVAVAVDPLCPALSVSVKAVGDAPTPPVVSLALTGTAIRRATLTTNTSGWSTGVYRLTLLEAGSPMKPDQAVNLAVGNGAVCQVDAITLTPTRVALASGDGRPLR